MAKRNGFGQLTNTEIETILTIVAFFAMFSFVIYTIYSMGVKKKSQFGANAASPRINSAVDRAIANRAQNVNKKNKRAQELDTVLAAIAQLSPNKKK